MTTLIKNGMVYDGTTKQPQNADIFVDGARIQEVSPKIEAPADTVIDAKGCAVTPGFVDIHRHCDLDALYNKSFGITEVSQGLTTVMGGNCGLAPIPALAQTRREVFDYIEPCLGQAPSDFACETMRDYLTMLDGVDKTVNVGSYVGIGTLKAAVKGYGRGAFTSAEMDKAQVYIREALSAGAVGLTTGIMYQPECYSAKEEFIQLISAAAPWHRPLSAHIRGEGDNLVPSVREIIDLAKRADVPLNISHFKATGVKNWGKNIHEAIEIIDAARAKGQDITVDFYPYCGGSTTLVSLLPPAIMQNSMAQTLQMLATQSGRAALRREIYAQHDGWDNMVTAIGWQRIVISSVTKPENKRFANMDFEAAAKLAGYDEPSDFMCDLLTEENGKVSIILLSMSQEDVDTVARLPYSMVISDSLYGVCDSPHPRLYGSFAKIIREYVNERGVLTMEQAIRKMTAMPAKRICLAGRGEIQAGAFADICVFDEKAFRDNADYPTPRKLCTGLKAVLINGIQTLSDDTVISRSAGTTIKL